VPRCWIAVLASIVGWGGGGCTTSTPPPGPERSPSPTLPSCVIEADCGGGEECRDGVCRRPGTPVDAGAPCSRECGAEELCVEGICVSQNPATPLSLGRED
jgi:hypothetical protein